jgi:methionine synthase II (cobalamin-independent)
MHVCWGNYPGPHHYHVPLQDIVDMVWNAKPHAIQFEAANPRHAHEWAVFERVKVPEGTVPIPGITSASPTTSGIRRSWRSVSSGMQGSPAATT